MKIKTIEEKIKLMQKAYGRTNNSGVRRELKKRIAKLSADLIEAEIDESLKEKAS